MHLALFLIVGASDATPRRLVTTVPAWQSQGKLPKGSVPHGAVLARGVGGAVEGGGGAGDNHELLGTVPAGWVATCRQRTMLHASRWGNCPSRPEPPLPEVATPLLRWVRAQQRVVLFGDSLMRDWFTMMVCLLIGASPTARVTPYGKPPPAASSRTMHGLIVLELPGGATLTFVWHQWNRKEFLPVNGSSPPALHTKEGLAVRDAKVLFFNMAGAHQRSAAELRADMSSLVTWLQGASPAQQRVVVEYAPSHFSGTPYGEYDASWHRPANFTSCPGAAPDHSRCAPHNASLEVSPANNWRRSVMREVAAEYHLSFLAVWDMSARSHDDHSEHGVCGRHGGGLRAGVRTDCRHSGTGAIRGGRC